jgi:regulator of protease activity HflC (stomatin/prohibitin superfamily)
VSPVAWVVLLGVALPAIGLLLFLLVENSRVVIPPGRLGLLLVKGRTTDTVLLPGPHWVASLRRRQVVEYPSVELTYRAGDTGTTAGDLERSGPPLPVVLGDRAAAVVRYTLRCRIDPEQLASVHERFGPEGLWAVVRDTTDRAVALALTAPEHGIDDVFGQPRTVLADQLAEVVEKALAPQGFLLTLFHLADVDLAGTGATIQDTVRARYDAELALAVADLPIESVRGYQEAELWREVARRDHNVSIVLPARGRSAPDRPGVQPPDGSGA